jgi:hypothetical protein
MESTAFQKFYANSYQYQMWPWFSKLYKIEMQASRQKNQGDTQLGTLFHGRCCALLC